jgi:hypothetical protein
LKFRDLGDWLLERGQTYYEVLLTVGVECYEQSTYAQRKHPKTSGAQSQICTAAEKGKATKKSKISAALFAAHNPVRFFLDL